MRDRQDKPNFFVYLGFLTVYGVALNTVYLVLPNEHLRWYLLGLLVVAVMIGYILSARHYITIGVILDIAGLAAFIYYGWQIYEDRMAFGTYLGEMLSVMLVLRCFKLFRYQDFLPPLVISLTLIVFSAIPSFSADFVYNLLGFLLALGFAMFLGSVDEFARLPRRKARHSSWRYTYGFLEDYAPVPVSKRSGREIFRFVGPAIKASVPGVLIAFILSSAFYFTVDHTHTPGAESPILTVFGSMGFDTDPDQEAALLTGGIASESARYYAGFDTEFNIAQGRLIENSTSTETVMEVESNMPSYWRGKCFDTYTGRGWVQSEETASTTWSLDPPAASRSQYHGEIGLELESEGIFLDPNFESDEARDEIRQTYYLETVLPGIVFTAYQPYEVSMPVPGLVIDDTFSIFPPPSADSMVSGQHYEVRSRKHFAQGDWLNVHNYDPYDLSMEDTNFVNRYTQLPERGTMENPDDGFDFRRIRAKAYEVTAGLDTVYDKVHALEQYIKTQYRYSLNPPSAVPLEKDAVDYFMFDWEQRRGHCEYFSSSMAVLCRSIGIPARVVTGYTTGNYNLLRNRYIVQERHAHAWVEVFWPDVGWVEFDPTPQIWYRGIGERAAGGWLLFHNAVENLYVYDPKGYFRDRIIPAIQRVTYRAYASTKYHLNQVELSFYELADPVVSRTETDREGPLWLLAGAFLILLASFVTRRILDPGRFRRDALGIGSRCLGKVRRGLVLRGVDAGSIATETDCATEAFLLSDDWGDRVSGAVDEYQSIRYSGRPVTARDVTILRRACRRATRIPRRQGHR